MGRESVQTYVNGRMLAADQLPIRCRSDADQLPISCRSADIVPFGVPVHFADMDTCHVDHGIT